VLTKPAAEDFLMPASVYGVDDCAGIGDLAWLDLNCGHSLLPEVPSLILDTDLVIKKGGVGAFSWHSRTA
jgi:hypothetical protein